ncbi:MAG: dCTP deaminase, partial [Saccharolobus sp.]
MIFSDRDLKYYLEKGWIKIEPLREDTIRENGVDLRIGNEIVKFKKNRIFDPDKDSIDDFIEKEVGNEFIINPHEHALLTTEEYV